MLSALLGASFCDALNTPHRGAKAYSGRALLLLLLAEQEGANSRLSQTRTVQRARFPRQSARSADFDLIDRSRPQYQKINSTGPAAPPQAQSPPITGQFTGRPYQKRSLRPQVSLVGGRAWYPVPHGCALNSAQKPQTKGLPKDNGLPPAGGQGHAQKLCAHSTAAGDTKGPTGKLPWHQDVDLVPSTSLERPVLGCVRRDAT